MSNEMSRREFIGLGTMAVAGAALIGCAKPKPSLSLNLPLAGDIAPDGPELRAGLVGCGGRGTGAALDFLNAGPNLRVTALGDVLRDRLESCRGKLKTEKDVAVPEENCFVGFEAFQKVIDAGVDVVILATPPHFRPEHFAAAVDAKKHVFLEKPVAVDPVGARSVIAASKRAEALGLCVATGTQRRHQRDYVETYKQVVDGAIGEIVAANCYWNQNQLWFRTREKGWSDVEYMIRDWVNWCWLSGDHIVEQHVHNIDVINWFTGSHPAKAVGVGSRQRRPTGDQFDFFSVDFVLENGLHLHSMCRQINGCATKVAEHVVGTRGYTDCRSTIYNLDGSIKWKYSYPSDESGQPTDKVKISPYAQEHIDLVTAIRTNEPFVEAENTAISTMTAIMGRISAYTGKEVTWDEVMSSNLRLGPTEYVMGPLDLKSEIPIAGTT